MVFDFVGGIYRQHLALIDHVAAIDRVQDFSSGVVGDQHTDPAFSQLLDYSLDRLHSHGVDTRKGLVEHNDLRVRNQASRNL